jgi:hypothetical protein
MGGAAKARGIALVNALLCIFVVVSLGLLLVSFATSSSIRAEAEKESAFALYIADAAAQRALLHIKDAFAQMGSDPELDWTPIDIVDSTEGWAHEAEYRIAQATDWQDETLDNGAHYTSARFRIQARTIDLDKSQSIEQVVEVRLTPLFQYAIFYNRNDLEIVPGPSMSIWGRIHGNQDIYLNAEGSSTLSINTNSLHAAGDIYRGRSRGEQGSGRVRITDASGSYKTMSAGFDSTHPDWKRASQARWRGVVKSGVHGVERMAVPAIDAVDPGGYYDRNADLRVVDGRAYTRGGTDITAMLPEGTLTSSTFYNGRESAAVAVTNVDLAKLAQTRYYPRNGLLYATRSDACPEAPNGIRLVNGGELAGPLTVASNDPVYTWGDYNKLDPKPAAIICDAITHLSNAWSDEENQDQNMREAADTDVNAALAAGGYQSTPDDFGGGFENFSRLLEDWAGKTLHVRGSYLYLWHSRIGIGRWQGTGIYYNPPNRDWGYDTAFDNPRNLPPFTPQSVQIISEAWGRR